MKEDKTYPLISIVMPIYNSARFLHKSIPSVMVQEYPNLEIVLLNNGSTDESAAIIEEYAEQDDRIKTYSIEHVGTPKESRDNAIYRSKGDWVIAVDSDDSIEPGYVEKLWRRHEETNADCVCGVMAFGDDAEKCIVTTPTESFDLNTVYSGTEAMLHSLFQWEIGLNGALWKRDLLLLTNRIVHPERDLFTDDGDGRIQWHASNKVAVVNAYYYYYCHDDSTGKKKSAVRILYSFITIYGLYKYFVENYGEQSILAFGCLIKMHRAYRSAIKSLLLNRRIVKKQLTKHQRHCMDDAYLILTNRKKDIGKLNWLEDFFAHKLYRLI